MRAEHGKALGRPARHDGAAVASSQGRVERDEQVVRPIVEEGVGRPSLDGAPRPVVGIDTVLTADEQRPRCAVRRRLDEVVRPFDTHVRRRRGAAAHGGEPDQCVHGPLHHVREDGREGADQVRHRIGRQHRQVRQAIHPRQHAVRVGQRCAEVRRADGDQRSHTDRPVPDLLRHRPRDQPAASEAHDIDVDRLAERDELPHETTSVLRWIEVQGGMVIRPDPALVALAQLAVEVRVESREVRLAPSHARRATTAASALLAAWSGRQPASPTPRPGPDPPSGTTGSAPGDTWPPIGERPPRRPCGRALAAVVPRPSGGRR